MRIILCFLPLIWISLTDATVTPRRKCVPKTHPKNQPPKVFTTEKLYKLPPYKVSIAPGPKGQGLQQVTTFRMYTKKNPNDIYQPTPVELKDQENSPKALLTQWREACYKGLGNNGNIFGGGVGKKVGFRIDYQKEPAGEFYNIQIQKNGVKEEKSSVAEVLIQKNILDGLEGGKLIAEGLDKSLDCSKQVQIERHFEIVPQGDEEKATQDDIQLVIGPGKGIILTKYALANRKEKTARKNEFRRPFNYQPPKQARPQKDPKH